jgi:hypothetical protein
LAEKEQMINGNSPYAQEVLGVLIVEENSCLGIAQAVV